tara:strand:+ start:219 stop:326 length:108 start_codon:yes stop_codon:yes gene_type:complete
VPNAEPIEDVIMAIILSFLSIGLKKVLYNYYFSEK